MLDFYPRSDGSKCPSNHNNIKGCWILSKVRWIEVSIQPQQYQRMLDFYPRSDGSKCPSNHNNIKGCWIYIQGPMDRSVHPTTTISKDVGFYPRSDGSKCPSNHNNIKTCWISDPNNSSVSMQTYKSQDQSYIWRGLFSGWSSGSVSCKYLGVYGKDVGGRMVWENGGKIFTSSNKNL